MAKSEKRVLPMAQSSPPASAVNGHASRRRLSKVAMVGGVAIGGMNPIVVQSMTDTDTADVEATTAQVKLLADAGSEMVRVTVNNDDAARAVPEIREAP